MATVQPNAPHTREHRDTLSRDVLSIGYTPDSDDAFNFFAWENGHVSIPGRTAEFQRHHISVLNQAASAEVFDVVNISSVMYPVLADRYRILATGSSVGRGYGPMLVSKHYQTIDELDGKRIAVADISTTGGMLAKMFCPGAEFHARPYHEIADAIVSGEFDAGVMIHEELIHYPEKGLHLVQNLGEAWTSASSLPLPVGLNIVSRRLSDAMAEQIQRTCHASLQWALDHSELVLDKVSQLGRGCADTFVPMFSNSDTLFMPPDVREALVVLFARTSELGLTPELRTVEIIDG